MSTPACPTVLTGIDGANPLGFLAAIGTLVTAHAAGEGQARLRWVRRRTWVPGLDGLSVATAEALSVRVADALRGRLVEPGADEVREAAQEALRRAEKLVKAKRQDIKKRRLTRAEGTAARKAELEPLERERDEKRSMWLDALRSAVPRPELALGTKIDCRPAEYREHATAFLSESTHATREPLDFLAAFGSDACRERTKDAIKPTPFCFITGSGHQYFLDTVRQLIEKVDADRVRQVLFDPWTYRDPKLSMRWDPIEDKRYALTDVRPADEGASTVWMANLLAYRGLALFSCAPARRGLATTAWSILNKEPAFTWPIWEFAGSPETIRSLLQFEELLEERVDRTALRARGVAAAFRARRITVGSGTNRKINFSPARAML